MTVREREMQEILRLKDIVKCYRLGGQEQVVLDNVNLTICRGDFIAILGPSGAGKSTLMNIIGCLDVPTGGRYILGGRDVAAMTEAQLARVRNREIGFVFQSFQLLPRLNALENVELPLIYAGLPRRRRRELALAVLERVGLQDKVYNYPNQLSGGQQQRVAIARSLVTDPALILADEPTGALDQKTGQQIMALFQELNADGRTVVVITHDAQVAGYARKILRIVDGRLFPGEVDLAGQREHIDVLG